MTMMKIEVVPDTSTPGGGHAIIRFKGIALLPPGAKYRIEPIDDAFDEGHDGGWPSGDLTPLETRQTEDGVEMRIGPDVVDAPLLEPGTPVTISVPDGRISAELVWPDLPVSAGGAAAPVVITPSQMAAELAAAERARHDAVRAAELAAKPDEVVVPPPLTADGADAPRLTAVEQQRMNGAARDLEAVLAQDPIDATGMVKPERERQRGPDKSLSSLNKGAHDNRPVVLTAQEQDTSLPAIVLKRANETAAPQAGVSRGDLRPETIEGTVSVPERRGRLLPFLAGAGAAGIAAAAILAVMTLRTGQMPFGASDAAPKQVATAVKGGIAEAFTAGYQSPRGEIATDVDLPTALRLADYNLHGIDRPVDRAEAEFWLRKAMSLTASHSQLRWAMTQLGTLQAEPLSGAPDYDKARMLWEISAANGDPVAMCFLGTLLEAGLGVSADRGKALDQYKRAKEFGGCPNADEAIARLSQ